MRKVGVLLSGVESDPDSQARIAAFRRGFAELGWREGENVHIEYRWSAGKSDLINRYAAELVALSPDVILANSTPVIAMLKGMTTSIPVVFVLATDPVGLGHVKVSVASGRQFYRLYLHRPDPGREMDRIPEGDHTQPGSCRAAVRSGHNAFLSRLDQ